MTRSAHLPCQSLFESEMQLNTVTEYVAMTPYYESHRALTKEASHLKAVIEVRA